MKSEASNRIDFANDIMKNQKRNKGEPKVHYNLMKYNKMREYKILEDISADVTLVQLMDSLVNVNHAISGSSYLLTTYVASWLANLLLESVWGFNGMFTDYRGNLLLSKQLGSSMFRPKGA